jgi:hypothetical protein
MITTGKKIQMFIGRRVIYIIEIEYCLLSESFKIIG